MIPLSMAETGREFTARRARGRPEIKGRLKRLGLDKGAAVTVVSGIGGNIIVNTGGSSIAISRATARRIIVCSGTASDH